MKRKTTKHRSKSHQSVLRARVITKRTVWFGFLKFSSKTLKFSCVLGILAAASWGVWCGVEHAFFKNPDFQLRVIKLNSNPVINEMGIATTVGIDLANPPNLFEIDINDAMHRLNALPEIIDAQVERHPPGTLHVQIIARSPVAWISSQGDELTKIRETGSTLVDQHGTAFPCPALLTPAAVNLPIIELPIPSNNPPTPAKKIELAELEHCFLLLDAARDADPDSLRWIDSIQQANAWSLLVKTRHGTSATFSLGDHGRQIESLRTALDHAAEKGYIIDTINLIPKYNIPITIRDGITPPKAILIPTQDASAKGADRRSRDMNKILNRN